jgi:hypothetical protein
MVAGIVQQLGVHMGPCQPPDAANPRGYFEDLRFRAMHTAWSRRYETDPERSRLRLPPWDPTPDALDMARYTRLIATCAERPRWGVKDPELCYYGVRFAQTLRRPIRMIATTRDPDATAASLRARRRWLTAADCERIIDDYARRQAATIAELVAHGNRPALTIDYDEALADPAGAVRRIAEHVDLPATEAAAAFVAPELRRHRPAQPVDTPRNDDQGVTTATM